MIKTLTLKSVAESQMPWTGELDYFKRHPVTEFKPGLNILFGGNGSGKSTVLQLLAKYLAAAQGGTSTITEPWMHELFGFSNIPRLPCDIEHDGQPVMFFDARAKEGLIGGGFDDDFFSLGVRNTMTKGSTGQLGFQRLNRMLEVLIASKKASEAAHRPDAAEPEVDSVDEVAQEPKKRGRPAKANAQVKDSKLDQRFAARSPRSPKAISERTSNASKNSKPSSFLESGFPTVIDCRINRKTVNSVWKERLEIVDEMHSPKCPLGPKTLLMDEPESGFSLPWQSGLWNNLLSKVDPNQFQLIVATHSPFALGIPNANYIEMTPGYLEQTNDVFAMLAHRLKETNS